jgi:hypothetical protein
MEKLNETIQYIMIMEKLESSENVKMVILNEKLNHSMEIENRK